MQSFVQYRKFRTAVQRQHERDKEKASALTSQKAVPSSSSRLLSPAVPAVKDPPDATNALEPRDLEKGEGATEPSGRSSLAPADRTGIHDGTYYPDGIQPASHPSDCIELEEGVSPSKTSTPTSSTSSVPSRLSRISTQRSEGTALGQTLTGIHVRDRTTKEGEGGQVFVVGYEGDADPLNPHNWSVGVRVWATALIAGIGFVVGVASSIDASALAQASEEFGVSLVVESLATGLYLIGFGAGALFAGPVSETLGRNPVYISTLTLYMVFIMASGLAPNIGAQLAFRFLAGFFGSTPLTCAGGSISDLWNPMERVLAFPVFAAAAFTGPVLGPVMGGYVASSPLISWRWTEWFTLIMSGLVLGLVVLFQPETYPPVLLKWKAKHLRDVTGDGRYKAEVEIRGDPFLTRLKHALYRPFLLTATEPIIMLIALYLTILYIVLFTFLDGYKYIFSDVHGTSEGVTGLCFLGIAVGLFLACGLVPVIYVWARHDLKKVQEQGGDRLPPEFRLWFSMLGGAAAIPISLFWMGWTSYPSISIWSPLAASVLFGYGVLCVFISSYQYIIDSYESFSASALASVTLIRYVAAGGMTVVGIPFYENMGVHWTLTILGGISALLVPVPYVFYLYGPKIRAKSRYAID